MVTRRRGPAGELCAWALVDLDAPAAPCKIHLIGTGWYVENIFDNYEYIGTVNTGAYMWHFFVEELNENSNDNN